MTIRLSKLVYVWLAICNLYSKYDIWSYGILAYIIFLQALQGWSNNWGRVTTNNLTKKKNNNPSSSKNNEINALNIEKRGYKHEGPKNFMSPRHVTLRGLQ